MIVGQNKQIQTKLMQNVLNKYGITRCYKFSTVFSIITHGFFSLLLVLILSKEANAQNNISEKKMNYKIGYQQYPWMGDFGGHSSLDRFKTFTPFVYFETKYCWLHYLETGIYIGGSYYRKITNIHEVESFFAGELDDGVTIETVLKPLFIYGITCNISVLPFIFKHDISYVDIYISSKIGGIYFVDKTKSFVVKKRPYIDSGIYGGIAVYPFKHWGLYSEYGIGNYVKWKAGMSFRF